ncbi:MAG: phosphoribosyltransferase [Actinobacteria bacterium]|nr:phosphoribosyltransferase [Actinomycetota bacterium]
MFRDRVDAGRRLARRLEYYKGSGAVVLAIPRGGVVVGDKVAEELNLPLDLIIPRKIGAPGNPELAIGAVVTRDRPMINEPLVQELGVPDSYIESEIEEQLNEIIRRRKLYLGDRAPIPLKDRVVIIVDDGLATGYTALAAINAVKQQYPEKLVLAIPVAPADTYDRMKRKVDEIVCLEVHELFFAVGQFYEDFSQTTDAEVIDILSKYRNSYQSTDV